MAFSYWQTLAIAGTITVTILCIAVPLILDEVFPWKLLRRQKNANLAAPTKSFKGKTVLITGANGAFGSRVAKIIANLDADKLILADVRDCSAVKESIEKELDVTKRKPDIQVWHVDMMSHQSCVDLANKAKRELKSLDGVLLVAGILSFKRRESPEGWETSIQVNYLSTALIAILLLPLLKSSPGNPDPPVMTFVTTFGVYPASPTMGLPWKGSYLKHLSNNKDGMAQTHQYGRSKGLLLYFSRELASRVTAAGSPRAVINSADPGPAWTPLTGPNQSMFIPRMIMKFSARDVEMCARSLVNGVSSTEKTHGAVLVDYDMTPYPRFMERASGREKQQRVWSETRDVLEKSVPEVKAVYAKLGGGEDLQK